MIAATLTAINGIEAWQGFAYVGFNVASTLKADILLLLHALDMAAFSTTGDLTGLTHHSDHGSDYMSLVYTDRIVEQVELATLEWVWWWNNQRLHSELGYRTPAEVEVTYYADHDTPRRQPPPSIDTRNKRCESPGSTTRPKGPNNN